MVNCDWTVEKSCDGDESAETIFDTRPLFWLPLGERRRAVTGRSYAPDRVTGGA